MRISRAGLLATTASASLWAEYLRIPAGAAEFSYKMGTDWPADHPISVRLAEAAANCTKDSGGRLELKFFPAATLGTSANMVSQVRLGAIEFACIGDNIVSTTAPAFGLTSLPFVFSNHKAAWDATDGALGKYIRDAAAKSNLFAFERSFDGTFRQLSNNARPIVVPANLHGLKIRLPESQTETATFKAFGCETASIDGSQMYMACQTHLVDGTELPFPTLVSFKMYEVQKYASETNHIWTGYTALGNPAAMAKLPKNLQDIVVRNMLSAAAQERADIVKFDATATTTLKEKGMQINEADIPSFKAAVKGAGLYAQWREQFGAQAWALLERSVGGLS